MQYFYAAAFYADCEHELFPVKGGMRLVLLYNLVRKGKKRAPRLAVEGSFSIDLRYSGESQHFDFWPK